MYAVTGAPPSTSGGEKLISIDSSLRTVIFEDSGRPGTSHGKEKIKQVMFIRFKKLVLKDENRIKMFNVPNYFLPESASDA